MIFLRHPSPDVSPGTCYGRTELRVSAQGTEEIEKALLILPPLSRLISSPAERCQTLSEAIARRDGVRCERDPRLLELDFGTWEGRAWNEIPRSESDPWAEDPWSLSPPNGESFANLFDRVASLLDEVTERDGLVLVTHAGPIRAAEMILTGASFAEVFARPVPYASPIGFDSALLEVR